MEVQVGPNCPTAETAVGQYFPGCAGLMSRSAVRRSTCSAKGYFDRLVEPFRHSVRLGWRRRLECDCLDVDGFIASTCDDIGPRFSETAVSTKGVPSHGEPFAQNTLDFFAGYQPWHLIILTKLSFAYS